jgi:peptide deformylase
LPSVKIFYLRKLNITQMILPIIGYGDPVLRKVGESITAEHPNLKEILANMYETMYNACGVGLAAPQVGLAIRLFIIDTTPFSDDDELDESKQKELKGFKKTFINAKMIKEEGDLWSFNEGCLSIPDVREDVYRNPTITIEYCEEDFVMKTEVFEGLIARVIQHEYDHIEGILFTDKLTPFRKSFIKKKLKNIMEGKTFQEYRMKFFAKKGR